MTDDILITLDVDWAPDFVIEAVARRLLRHRVKATWFVTHKSPAIDRLREAGDLFELGIHPNFLPGSSHGDSIDAVLSECMRLVPDARTMRAHDLFQSTTVFKRLLASTPIRADVSLFLPNVKAPQPFQFCLGGESLWRLPYSWEDDYEMLQSAPDWSGRRLLGAAGMQVVDFHPIHVYLNSSRFEPYERLKAAAIRLQDATRDHVDPWVAPDSGAGTLFDEVVAHLGALGRSRTVSEALDVKADARVLGV